MIRVLQPDAVAAKRAGERGAAMVMALLFSVLLLAAGGALILTTAMSTVIAVDSTSEMQAYYGAEAGMQAVMSVLRGNVPSSPAGTKATFRNAANNPTLSQWLQYNATVGATQVVSVNTAGNPFSAYRINVMELDNTPAAEEPPRLLVQVTGYGPRGSIKQMEMVVNKGPFDFDPPAAILLVGAEAGASMQPGDFDIGDSSPKGYAGTDAVAGSAKVKATFGFTQQADKNLGDCTFNPGCSLYTDNPNPLFSSKSIPSTDDSPRAKYVTNAELPSWLRTANATRFFLSETKATAQDANRYFTAAPDYFGTANNPVVTYVDGDCDFSGNGGGLLIVTGNLTLKGDFKFDGVILVLGQGFVLRNGGGGGGIYGALVMANLSVNGNGNFLSRPIFNTNGGGNSEIKYHSQNVARAFETLGPSARAVREK